MTDNTQPEAMRLADDLEASSHFPGNMRSCNNAAAAELRRQHARIAELEAEQQAARSAPGEPDRGDATNLARNAIKYPDLQLTVKEARCLAYAVLEMDKYIATAPQQEAQEPFGWACWIGEDSDPRRAQFSPVEPLAYSNRKPLYTAPQPTPAPAPLSDDVVKDAARYAALRDGSIEHDNILKTVKDPGKWEQPYAVLLRGIALDSAIDAALAAQGARYDHQNNSSADDQILRLLWRNDG